MYSIIGRRWWLTHKWKYCCTYKWMSPKILLISFLCVYSKADNATEIFWTSNNKNVQKQKNLFTCFFRTSCCRWPYRHQYAKCCELCQSSCLAFCANDTWTTQKTKNSWRVSQDDGIYIFLINFHCFFFFLTWLLMSFSQCGGFSLSLKLLIRTM